MAVASGSRAAIPHRKRTHGRPGAPRRDEQHLPVRVAVISRSDVVRAGLVHLVAQLGSDAIVTEAVSLDGDLHGYDVAVYDLSAIGEDRDSQRDLRGLTRGSTQVVGLVYDERHRPGASTVASTVAAEVPLVTLAVTPEEFSAVLRAAIQAGEDEGRPRRLPGNLSAQEFRVIELIGAGMTNEAIAKELFVSSNTVKTYIRVAYRKINVTDRATAILWALRHGLAGGPDRR